MNAAALEDQLIKLVIQTNGPWRLFERGEMTFIIEANETGHAVMLEFLTIVGWVQNVPGRWLAQTTMRRTSADHVAVGSDKTQLRSLIAQLLDEENKYQIEHSLPQPKGT